LVIAIKQSCLAVVLKEPDQDFVAAWFENSLKVNQIDIQLDPVLVDLKGDDEDQNRGSPSEVKLPGKALFFSLRESVKWGYHDRGFDLVWGVTKPRK
jgi:hypothetical protein